MNCLIIDDEPLAVSLLESYLRKIPEARLAGSFTDALSALPLIENGKVQLLFMDIKMPDILGVDLYRSLKYKPEVIFTTAFSEYAIEGFELNAVDFLLKPISFERFLTAFNKARDYIAYKKAAQSTAVRDYFFINVSHKINKIFYSDILYMEGLKDYTKIYLSSQQHPLLTLNNLKYFEDILPPQDFVRIHRSYIASLSKINTISRKSVSIGPCILPVSDLYRDRLFALIGQQPKAC